MRTKLSYRFCLFTALIIASAFVPQFLNAQLKVTKVTGPEMLAGKKGIIYNLSRTLVYADLSIAKTQLFAGPLAEYAGEYLSLDDVVTKNSVNYEIRDAKIRTSVEPDPGQYYIIEKEEKASGEMWISFGKQSPVLTLEKFDKTVSPPGFIKWNEDHFVTSDSRFLYRKYTESPTREVIDTIIRKVSIDTLVLEEMTFRYSMVEFTDREKAQEAAARIKQIENDQYNLLIGYQETAYSKETLEFMLQKLEEQRLDYLKLFTGISLTEIIPFEFMVIPGQENEEGEYILAGFSSDNGITGPEAQDKIKLAIKTDSQNLAMGSSTDVPVTAGIAYRLPQIVQAVLSFDDLELASARIEVLQLAPVLALPQEFKRVEFDTETGTLKSIVIE